MNAGSTKKHALSVTSPSASPTRLRFWGVRGSIPVPGAATIRYGGNTSCVEVRAAGQIIVLDAGTGVRVLGRHLVAEFDNQPIEMTLLLTHTHWDHIQGLPFFLPAYKPQNHLRILGYEGARHSLETVLAGQMERPFFPIGLREVPANVVIEELTGMDFRIGLVRVRACPANHPGRCVGYRLDAADSSIVFFPDNEPYHSKGFSPQSESTSGSRAPGSNSRMKQQMSEFLRGADVLIMDTQFDAAEYQQHLGWGHGCLDDVVELALQAEVKQLLLFHHDPDHDDRKISQMVAHARKLVTARKATLQINAAREGMTVEWPLKRRLSKR